jgi:hypothetical protein
VKIAKKPPTKEIVLLAQTKTEDLKTSVKFQAWAMYQQEKRKNAIIACRLKK